MVQSHVLPVGNLVLHLVAQSHVFIELLVNLSNMYYICILVFSLT